VRSLITFSGWGRGAVLNAGEFVTDSGLLILWKLMPLTFGPMTLLWCGHVYKFSHRFRNRELCEWPVREGTRLSAQSRLSRFERAPQLHPQALRLIPLALPSRLPQMRALLAPVSEETT
jgi:hypothetical protein